MRHMWEIVGHETAVESLRRALSADRLSHALLLVGPSGVGKRRLALELAMALNCEGDDVPCRQCLDCRQIAAGSHPDVLVIEHGEGKDSIAIQQVRELRDAASLRPFQGRRKVYVIADAEELTLQAADALLKTLEEPHPQVTIVLTAAEVDGLPGTIVSRCRVIPLRAVEAATIARALIGRGLDEAEAERVARLARGSAGWALRAAAQPKLVAQREELIGRLSTLLDLNVEGRLQLAESLTTDRKDRSAVRRHLELLTLLAGDLLLLFHDLPPRLVSGADSERLRVQATRLGLEGIMAYLGRLRRAMERIDQNVDPRLALEAAIVSLP